MDRRRTAALTVKNVGTVLDPEELCVIYGNRAGHRHIASELRVGDFQRLTSRIRNRQR
ncbi:MAG: hypothetical protein HC888_03545 [Candidatus Competibacteraceae bacterium]|nr:hypothetical protein [Candidatus Competibacteraceae bacterium]